MAILPLFTSLLFLLSSGTPSSTNTADFRLLIAQDTVEALPSADEVTAPQYPGGKEAMLKFLAKNTKYPTRAQLTKTAGFVMMQVTIDATGTLKDIKAAHSDSPLLETEPLRVLKLMPKWEPAKSKGVPVASTYLFPFMFHIANAEGSNKELPKDRCIKFAEEISPELPNQPVYVSEEVTVTGYGVVKSK